MEYTFRQLKIFTKVVELQSITKASEELFLTQPAVSIQLKKFQEQFSIPLTEVIGRKLYVTEFGYEVAEAAEKILNEVEAINYKAQTFKNEIAGKLKISVVSTGKYVMPYFLAEFINKNPGVELLMDVTNKSLVVDSLEKNEVDFSLVSVLPDQLKINNLELMENKLYLVGSKSSTVKLKIREGEILENKPIIYREKGSATRTAMENFMKTKKVYAKKKLELTSNEAIKQAIIAGLGFSVVPIIGIRNELMGNDVEIIPTEGLPITTNWNLIWLTDKQLSPVAQAYLDFVKEEKDRIIQENFDWVQKY